MFEHIDSTQRRRLPGYAAFSLGAHGALIALFILAAAVRARAPAEKLVQVSFVGPGHTAGAPPPPPPPAGKRRTPKHKPVPTHVARIEIPRAAPQKVAPDDPPEADDDEGVEGGVEGGVVGGVVGGVLGGTVGGTGGGGAAPPPEPPKAKNVPPFVIARDAIQSPMPRMTEIFRESHRGQQTGGLYKVCVGTDGHVYDVAVVKSVAGADEQIAETLREEWLYKPQPVPVCFLYNFQIRIVQ